MRGINWLWRLGGRKGVFGPLWLAVWLAWASHCGLYGQPKPKLPPLKISENGRYLVTDKGEPFFWLGDTAWFLVLKASRESNEQQPGLDQYFQNRHTKGFTVLQTSLLSEAGKGPKNAYGHDPFENGDYSKPLVKAGPDNDFWDMVDYIIDKGQEYGIYLALLPVWNNSIPAEHQLEQDPQVAYRYGHFLGNRYKTKTHIIWVMGGDPGNPTRYVSSPSRLKMVRAIAEGIADGVNGQNNYDGTADYQTTLMSYHPPGAGRSSGNLLHNEPWLDFNMIQTGTRFEFANYESIQGDYAQKPPKPTLDSEVTYEYSNPLQHITNERARYGDKRLSDTDVRRAAYWSVFAGGFGFTYGHRSFIQWLRKGETVHNGGDMPWYRGLDAPGSFQMSHLKKLMLSRPFLTRIPDQTLISWRSKGYGNNLAMATRDEAGTYALVYAPLGSPLLIELSKLSAPNLIAHWYDPRVGVYHKIGDVKAEGMKLFEPPSNGEGQDWILILDDATKNYPLPEL